MTKQVRTKIFLADERGLNETAWLKSWNTFNFGKYQQEHKQSFGDMYVLNDDTLDGHRSLSMLVEENSWIILLPVAGAVKYKDSSGNENFIAAGQVQILAMEKNSSFELINPFKNEQVNFLQFWIKGTPVNVKGNPCICTYNVNEFMNSLGQVSPQTLSGSPLPFTISVGKFSGRGETIYQPKSNNTGLFVFVLEGAFEVEGRLLHARDGLALSRPNKIEMEALSSDAIICSVELPLTSSDL